MVIGQVIAGFAVGVGTSWSGVGVVGGGFMIANGGAAIWSGISQIVNDVSGSNYHEENYIRTGARAVGNAIGRNSGGKGWRNYL